LSHQTQLVLAASVTSCVLEIYLLKKRAWNTRFPLLTAEVIIYVDIHYID